MLVVTEKARPKKPTCFGHWTEDEVSARWCPACFDREGCRQRSGGNYATPLDVMEKVALAERDPNGLALHEPGAKADAGKQLAGVLFDFSHALSAVADVGTMGAAKYSRGGWRSVPNGQQRYLDAMMRHLLKHGQGELVDPESGHPHLAHATWNLMATLDLWLCVEAPRAC